MTAATLPEDPAELAVAFKPGLYSKRPAWRSIRLADVPEMVASWSPALFASGQLALWLSARAETEAGPALLPWLDVEAPGKNHGDVSANILTAQRLFIQLEEAGLNVGLVLLLTGRGFRFCWPFAVEPELAAPFLAMIRDHARWPGIDPQPQVSGMPLALAGYRGHRSQGAKGDVHFQALADPSDVLNLTPYKYAGLVAGPAELADCMQALVSLQPKTWTPPAWRLVLEDYRRELLLRSNIIRMDPPKTPEPPAAVPWAVIENHLAGLNIRVVRELELSRGTVRNLSTCPICGKADKAFLAGGGRLKCFSSGCAAGQVQVDLRGEAFRPGLPLREWAAEIAPAGHDDAETVEQIHHEDDDTATIETARAAIREALYGDGPTLIEVSAGVGKTFAAEAFAIDQAAQGKTVLFAAPTLDLAGEIHNRITQAVQFDFNLTAPPRLYQGRSKENCQDIEDVNEAASNGFSPGLIFCLRCFHKSHCKYLRQFEQFERGGIVVASHSAAPTVIAKLQPDLVIFDENPRDRLFETEAVTFSSFAMIRRWFVNDAEKAFDKIVAAAFKLHKVVCDVSQETKKKKMTGRLYAGESPTDHEDKRPVPPQNLWDVAELTDDERQAMINQLWFFMPLEKEAVSTWQQRLYFKHRINLSTLSWLFSAFDILPNQTPYILATTNDTNAIHFCYTRKQEMTGGHRVVVLDATPDVEELNRLMGREFKVVRAIVPPKKGARLVHVKVAMGKVKATRLADSTLLGYLKKATAYLKPTDKKVLLLTHKRLAKKLLDMARQLDPSREWGIINHFAGKGLNAYQHFDAGVVIGTPTASIEAFFDMAVAIYGNDVVRRTGWMAGLGMRDLIQSISRLRPVLKAKTVVVVGRHWPGEALGAPSFSVDESRKGASGAAMEEAYRRLLPLARSLGVMFTEAAALAGVFLANDKEGPATWREWVKPILAGESTLEFAGTLREIFIRVAANSDPLSPEPIILSNRGHDWSELVARLADAAALPECTYKPGRRGRPQAACGSAAAVMALCEAFGREFLPELWTFHEPETETATAQEEQRTMTKPADPLAAALAVREPFTADAMTRPPGVPPDAYFPPLAARLCAEVA